VVCDIIRLLGRKKDYCVTYWLIISWIVIRLSVKTQCRITWAYLLYLVWSSCWEKHTAVSLTSCWIMRYDQISQRNDADALHTSCWEWDAMWLEFLKYCSIKPYVLLFFHPIQCVMIEYISARGCQYTYNLLHTSIVAWLISIEGTYCYNTLSFILDFLTFPLEGTAHSPNSVESGSEPTRKLSSIWNTLQPKYI